MGNRLRGIAIFDRIVDFPARVLCWSWGWQTWTHHTHPIFDPTLEIGLHTLVHTVSLGLYQTLVGKIW